jgi:hypothetical protein
MEQEEEKKTPFDQWLDYARTVVRAIENRFPKDMSAIQATIIEKALKPYHFWLEEQGLPQSQKITANQKIFIEKILSQKSQRSREIVKALNGMKKSLEDLTKDEASQLLDKEAPK